VKGRAFGKDILPLTTIFRIGIVKIVLYWKKPFR
jgi:hypothetical protein